MGERGQPFAPQGKAVVMIRLTVVLVALLGLVACGGGSRYASTKANYGASTVLFASGPLQQACRADRRKAASRARCGCIQAVANRELSASDQRRGASFFKNPHRLQEVRQSDNAGNERFWAAWKAYGARAAELCAGT